MNRTLEEAIPRNIDRLLGELGLARRASATDYILPALGIFAAGVVVGGVVGLLLAPKPGRELRGDLERRVRTVVDNAAPSAQRDGVPAQA